MGVLDYNSPTASDTDEKDELTTQFDKSIALVRDYTSRIEEDYVRPALKISYAYSKDRPLTAVFLAFFGAMSTIPILIFLGTSLFTTAILCASALFIALVASAGIIIGLLAVLCSVLTGAFFGALFLSFGTVCTYLFVRFAVLVKRDGPRGAVSLVNEIKQALLGRQAVRGRQSSAKPLQRSDDVTLETINLSDKSADDQPTGKVKDEDVSAHILKSSYDDYGVKEQGE